MPDRPQSIRPVPVRPDARRAPAHSFALALALVLLPALPAPAQSPASVGAAAIARGEPRLTDDLQAYQQAWKGFAEQRCAFEAMLLRGSPKRMLAAATCLLRTTAEQALFLETSARH